LTDYPNCTGRQKWNSRRDQKDGTQVNAINTWRPQQQQQMSPSYKPQNNGDYSNGQLQQRQFNNKFNNVSSRYQPRQSNYSPMGNSVGYYQKPQMGPTFNGPNMYQSSGNGMEQQQSQG